MGVISRTLSSSGAMMVLSSGWLGRFRNRGVCARSRRFTPVERRPRRQLDLESLENRLVLDSTVVFNEIMYNPAGSNEQLEWIELYNQMAVDVDMSNWSLQGGVDYTFPPHTVVPGGGYVVIAKSPAELAAASGVAGALGPFEGQLANGGEELQLVNHNARVMDVVDYSDDGRWAVGPDGSGASLAKLRRSAGSEDAANWAASEQLGGTPGALNFADGGPTGPTEATFVGPASPTRYHVPTSDALGTTWTNPAYDDSSQAVWQTGSFGIGYDSDVPPEVPTSSLQNVALLKPVISTSGNYAGLAGFEASNVTDGSSSDVFSSGAANSSTYWLGREGVANESFVLDLQQAYPIEEIRLRNTHNTQYNDRGTAQFRIFASNSVNASNQLVNPVQILTGALPAVSNQSPILANVYRAAQGLTNTTARYLRFEVLTSTYGNNNVGLNEIEVYSAAPASRTNYALGRPVIDASGVYQYASGFEPSNVTDGSTIDVTTDNTANSSTYWLGREGVSQEYVTVDLQANVKIDEIRLRNTHNVQFNDRGTADFELYAASAVDADHHLVNPQLILSGTLPNVSGQTTLTTSIFAAAQGLAPTTARYLRFNALSSNYATGHVGLNEIEVYGIGPASPIAYWNFDDTLADASGNGHDGAMAQATFAATGAPGTTGKALSFDGVDDYMSALVDVSETSYTSAMWIKTTAANVGMYAVVDADLGATGHDRHLYLTGTDLGTRTWNTETITSTGLNLADDQWHHIAHVFGGSTGGQVLYVDGVRVASGSKATSDFTAQTRINLGFSNDAALPYFNGLIDEAAIWSQALTPAQIQLLASGTSPLVLSGLSGQIATDVQTAMENVSPSLYTRTEFVVPANTQYDSLALDMKYDDGFVAYLNGTKVAESNAPPSPAWNSTAGGIRPDALASAYQSFDLSAYLPLLHTGTNVLAIHGLNSAANDTDVLLSPRLRAHITPPETFAGALAINEVAGGFDGTFAVEIVNHGTSSVQLAGLVLATTEDAGSEYVLPAQSLAPGQFASFSEAALGFRVASGEKLFLYAAGKLALLDAVNVKDAARGRSPDGAGEWRYTAANTFGNGATGANSFAFRDEVVINEIMYHHRPALAAAAAPATYATTTLIPINDTWKYSDLAAEPAAQGPNTWRQTVYNDSSWASGGALLYYNTTATLPAARTTALTGARNTYYFRKTFSFTGDLTGATLELRHIVDDGAVFYLNGVVVARFNMNTPEVPLYTSPPTAVVGIAAYSSPIQVPIHLLHNDGTPNVLAVEVHNFAAAADAVFGAELVVKVQTAPPVEGSDYAESDEEWIELYNRSNHAVDLTDWDVSGGLKYEFAAGTTIPAGGYLVVANNPAALLTKYPGISVVGGFTGGLNNVDDRVVLEDNHNNPADEVHYFEAGRWAAAADGGGSSMELRDPNADNAQAEAWGASNESLRTNWAHYTYTSTAIAPVYDPVTSQAPSSDFREFILGLLDAGDVLIDNISVREDPSGTNIERIQNGTFTADAIGAIPATWRVLGTHSDSRVVADPDPAHSGNKVFYINADSKADYLDNHLETTLVGNAQIVPGRAYSISFDAKWLSGTPQLRSELYYNRVAKVTKLDQPMLSGTPGAANSILQANIGPTYEDFKHGPVIPDVNEPATVSVVASDPDTVASVTLRYAVNGGAWQSVAMTASGGGLYTAAIPGQAAGATVQFYVQGLDALGVSSTFPALGVDSRALIRWQDGRARTTGLQHNFRMLMTAADVALLHSATNLMSNDRLGGTIVYDETEVFYDVGIRLRGSMFSRQSQGSTGYNIKFNADQLFRGVHQSVAIKTPGKAEILVKYTEVQGDIPGMYDDFMYLNTPSGAGDGIALSGLARYGDEFITNAFEDGSDGTVFKMQGIRVLLNNTGTEALKTYMPIGWVGNYDLANLGNDQEQYRWSIQIMNNRAQDDYGPIVDMMQAMSLTGAALQDRIDDVIDVDQWMRVFALQSLWGIGDAYTAGNPHNIDFYIRPEDGKVIAMPWDWNFVASYGATSPLYGFQNGNLLKIINLPVYKRLFMGHMQDWVNTVFNTAYMSHWTQMYGQLAGENYDNYLAYIGQRSAYVMQLITQQAPPVAFNITTNGGNPLTVNTPTAAISGDGWVNVRDIRLAGSDIPLAVQWTDFDSWTAIVPVAAGTHPVTLEAYDYEGNLLTTDTISVNSTASSRPLQDYLRITEVMYHPADPSPSELAAGFNDADDFEFIELQNTSPSTTLDLAGVRLADGVSFTFAAPSATSLPPSQRIVVVKNIAAFTERYGNVATIAGEYADRLNNSGEHLLLVDSVDSPIADFTYDDTATGWHPTTDGEGYSLVVVDTSVPLTPASDGTAWRPSFAIGGSPGADESLPGDLDGNQRVDLVDMAILQSHLGVTSGALAAEGDLDGDGAVNRRDASLLAQYFGHSTGAGAPAAPQSPSRSALSIVRTRAPRSQSPEAPPVLRAVRRIGRGSTALNESAAQQAASDEALAGVTSELVARRGRR
jgi:hypothetical protein